MCGSPSFSHMSPHLLMTLPLSGLSKLSQAFASCHLICSSPGLPTLLSNHSLSLPAFLGNQQSLLLEA